jgi:uncharacterized hydrophobic protein (TIGR00271 family)
MNRFSQFINLHNGEEEKNVVKENVLANISFRGSNLWILACAIAIASVGLNVNSTAVIIGAMLISPLMGPIVGAGFALGTYDFLLLKKALKNLFIATVVSLSVSAVYFYLSPFKDAQSELLARTSPNIYDVLIAFFGGVVGAITITRKEKGNPLAGVAIATALMPPICTVGYGIAIGNLNYIAGAFYLYVINCFFICLSTFLIIKYLKYPIFQQVDEKVQKKVRNITSILVLFMIVPSVYLAFNLFMEKSEQQKCNNFIKSEFTDKGYTLIYKDLNLEVKPKVIALAFVNKQFNQSEITSYNSKLKKYKISNTKLVILQDTNIINSNSNEISSSNLIKMLKEADLNLKADSANNFLMENNNIMAEVKVLFPSINNVAYNTINYKNIENNSLNSKTVVLIKSEQKIETEQLTKFEEWIKIKLKLSEVIVVQDKK